MAVNQKTCTSEQVTYKAGPRPDSYSYRPGALQLVAVCADCETRAAIIVDEFGEDWIAGVWNAHHARQLAECIKWMDGGSDGGHK